MRGTLISLFLLQLNMSLSLSGGIESDWPPLGQQVWHTLYYEWSEPMIEPASFSDQLLAFYDEHARALPFRIRTHPYYTWISEIMLQQTRMETVLPYFERFIQAIPDVPALASVSEEQLLKLWEGLGYYSRARNLQQAARRMMSDHGGELPDTVEELLKLPGIGPYTAGAIASIAFHRVVPAVDGNVIRVFSRLMAYGGPVMSAPGKRYITEAVQSVMSKERPGDFNQAVMELGATICLPNGAPLCQACPVREHCLAFSEGNPLAYPVLPAKKERRIEQHTVFLILQGNRFAIERRPRRGLLAGLHQFPMRPGDLTRAEVSDLLADLGFTEARIEDGPGARHIFSHVEWQMSSYIIRVSTDRIAESGFEWEDQTALSELTLPTAFAVFRREMEKLMGEA